MSREFAGLTDCPVCGGPGPWSLGTFIGSYAVAVCGACGSGVTVPTPTIADVDAINADTYTLVEHVTERQARRAELAARSKPLLDWARSYGSVASAVDIGSHLGYLVSDLRSLGVAAVAGVELNQAMRDWAAAEHGIEFAATCADLPAASWDLVTMLDVLEHTPDPLALLGAARDLARPGGLVLVQSPNRMSDMARRAGPRWSWWAMPDHVVHFSPGGLELLAARAGLAPVRVITGDFVPDFIMDVFPRIPGEIALAARKTGLGRRFYARRSGKGGLIRALFRRSR